MLTPHITVRNADMAIVPLLRGRIDPGKQIKLLVAFASRKLIRRGHIIGDDGEPAHQQTRIHDALVQHRHRLTDASGRRGELPQSDRPGGRLGDPPPIPVDGHRPAIALARLIGGPFHRRIRAGIQFDRVKAADVVADRERQTIRQHPLADKIQGERVRHLLDDEPSRGIVGGPGEHLPTADAVRIRLIRLDVRDRARLPAPCVVDEQFGVHAEHAVQQILVVVVGGSTDRTSGDIPHVQQPRALKLPGIAATDPPEIRKRTMVP